MNSETRYGELVPEQELEFKRITTIVYALQAAGFFTAGLTFIAGLVLNYIKREDVENCWIASHFRWQIRTFWFGLLWGCLAWPLVFLFGIGIPLLFANTVWIIYRIIKGWVRLSENKQMYPVVPVANQP